MRSHFLQFYFNFIEATELQQQSKLEEEDCQKSSSKLNFGTERFFQNSFQYAQAQSISYTGFRGGTKTCKTWPVLTHFERSLRSQMCSVCDKIFKVCITPACVDFAKRITRLRYFWKELWCTEAKKSIPQWGGNTFFGAYSTQIWIVLAKQTHTSA